MRSLLLLSAMSLFSNFTLMTCTNDAPEEATVTPPPCVQTDIPFTTMESYFGCQNTKNTMNVNLTNNYVIFRTQAQFNQLVTNSANCPVNIDISNYDLVIGKKQLSSGNQTINYEYFTTSCTERKLRVTFVQNSTMMAPNVTYHVLIPKLSNNETLVVETIVN